MTDVTKTCSRCGEDKPLTEYGRQNTVKSGRRAACKDCCTAQRREWARRNPEKEREYKRRYRENRTFPSQEARARRDRELRRMYGISLEDMERMIRDQDGGCAICSGQLIPREFHVDHCHDSGKLRAVLCRSCNTGLGFFKDSAELLTRALRYLESHAS